MVHENLDVNSDQVNNLAEPYQYAATDFHNLSGRIDEIWSRYKDAWGHDSIGAQVAPSFEQGFQYLQGSAKALHQTLNYYSTGLSQSGKVYGESEDNAAEGGQKLDSAFSQLETPSFQTPTESSSPTPFKTARRMAVESEHLVRGERIEAEPAHPLVRFERVEGKLLSPLVRFERIERKLLSPAERVEAPLVSAERVEAPLVSAERVEAPLISAERVEAPMVSAERVEAPMVSAERVEAQPLMPAESMPAQYMPAQYIPPQPLMPAESMPTESMPAQYIPAQPLMPAIPAGAVVDPSIPPDAYGPWYRLPDGRILAHPAMRTEAVQIPVTPADS